MNEPVMHAELPNCMSGRQLVGGRTAKFAKGVT